MMGKSSDKRILCGQVFVAMAFLCSFFGILTSDLRPEDQLILALMVSILTLLHFIGLAFLRQNKSASLIFVFLATYIWIAYPIQFLITLHDPQSSDFLLTFFRPEVIQKEIVAAFYTVFPGIIALFTGLLIGRNNFSSNFSSSNYVLRHSFFIIIIVGLMLLKVFVQAMGIGMPGITPEALPIPFLVGFLAWLTRSALFAIVNLYFYSVLRFGDHKGLLIALSLLFINILIALRVGWKTELVLQGLLMAYYILDTYDDMSTARRRLIYLITLLSIVGMLILYPLINVYRHQLSNEQDFSNTIARTGDAIEKTDTDSSLHSFLDRVNGIRAYYLAIKLGSGREFPLESLLNQNVPELVKERLYGRDKDKAVTAFGTTQLSVLYLIGGVPFLILGCLIIGVTIRWTGRYINKRIFLSSVTFEAYVPFFSILWVQVLASGGGIPLLMKQFGLVLGCLFAMERLCYKKRELSVTNDELHSTPVEHEPKFESRPYV